MVSALKTCKEQKYFHTPRRTKAIVGDCDEWNTCMESLRTFNSQLLTGSTVLRLITIYVKNKNTSVKNLKKYI